LSVNYIVATIVAIEMAILFNYLCHEQWTWRDRPARSARERCSRLLRFNAMTALTSIAGGVLITAALVELFGMPPVAANVISVVALGMLNFAGADSLVFRAGTGLVVLAIATSASASEEAKLQPRTLHSFAKYVAAVEARRAKELTDKQPFLALERYSAGEQARIMATLRRGEIFVERAAARDQGAGEIAIDGGSINHWRGTVFVPHVKLDQVLKVLQEPQTDKHKQEDVISSRVVSRNGDSQKVYLRLRRTKFVTVVYDTEYDVDYKRLAPDRAISNSISTKIVEIENAGTPRERALPEGDDHGYMWRLNSYWRYKQLPDGVLVEVESLTLSRDLPPIIGPLIRPIVNSTARESMTRTLASVRARFG
ncbi:MAG TPA: GtrA family protein, partial [Vicinamibacterales bacterium]|nr:GtrA family protein [Vicinamibacterales bacterium]